MNQVGSTDMKWYYVDRGEKRGPCEISQLRRFITSGSLRRDTLIWREGMADWIQASTIPELAKEFSTVPEEIEAKPLPTMPPAVRTRPETGDHTFITSAKKRNRIIFIITTGFAIISLVLPWAYIYVPRMPGQLSFGLRYWEAIVVVVLALVGLLAAIIDLVIYNKGLISQIMQWIHLGIYTLMTLFASFAILIPLAESLSRSQRGSSEYSPSYGYPIPIVSIIVLGLSIIALVLITKEIRTRDHL